jgi:hypothetical protein
MNNKLEIKFLQNKLKRKYFYVLLYGKYSYIQYILKKDFLYTFFIVVNFLYKYGFIKVKR